MQINREQLAWAAGFFEGEGCFTIMRGARMSGFYPHVVVVNTDKDVLETLQRIMGFGVIRRATKEQPHHKDKWRWVVHSYEQVQQVVCYLWPWLHSRRRARIKEIFGKYHEHTELRKLGLVGKRKRRLLHPITE